MTDTPWWARIPCNCWGRPPAGQDWWGRDFWCLDCGQRWRLTLSGAVYSWVKG